MSGKGQAISRRVTKPGFKPRAGEGLLIDVVQFPQESVTGGFATSMSADLSGLPVPERRYSADVAAAFRRHEMYWLLFGQERISEAPADLRTLVIVKLAPESLRAFLRNCRDEAYQSLFAAERGGQLSEIKSEPAETVAFNATFVLMANTYEEGCLDFFHSSPFALADSQVSGKLAVEPVLRVSLPTALLVSLIQGLEELFESSGDSDEN